MKEICYLIGKTVSARQALLLRSMKEKDITRALHLVPTKGKVMELETDTLFWLQRRVETLTGIIHQIFEEDIKPEKYSDYSHIDGIAARILIKKALVNRSMEPDGLACFNNLFTEENAHRDYPGICRNISSFFTTIYRNNYEDIYANLLGSKILLQEEISPGTADERYGLESDLLWLMGDYEELKRDIKVYDEDDIFLNVREYLQNGGRPSYLEDYKTIILDGLTHFSRIEEEILYHLVSSAEELWWLIDFDSKSDDPMAGFRQACSIEKDKQDDNESCRICYSLVSLMDRLHKKDVSVKIEKTDEIPYPNPYAGALYTGKKPDTAGTDSLKTGSFTGDVDEVRAIASEIKRILFDPGQKENVNPGDIRVIFPDLNDYASIVSEIFSEYGLPFSLTKGIPLSSHPLSHIFLKIFELPLEGFRRDDIFGLFSSKIINFEFARFELPELTMDAIKDEHLLPGDKREDIEKLSVSEEFISRLKNPDVFLFDTALKRCGIERLGHGLENLALDQIPVFRKIYITSMDGVKNRDDRKALGLEYYLFIIQGSLFKAIFSPFIELMTCSSPNEIYKTCEKLTELLGFPANIIDINVRDSVFKPNEKRTMLKRDIRAFSLLNDLVNISHREMNLVQRLFNIKKSDILVSSFYDTFKNRINNKYLLDERNPDVIRVSQWLEARGRSFDYVFAGGLTANKFPLKEEADFIIPESLRGRFRIIDPVDQSKHLFCHLLKNYKKRLYISWPESISEKQVQPSQILQDLFALMDTNKDDRRHSWESNPFYASVNELLNAGICKNENGQKKQGYPSNLENIIIKEHGREEDIIRGIKTFAARSAGNGLFEYDGLVKNAPGFKVFSSENIRSFSYSSLETLANCPMRYLFKYIYKLKDTEEITPEASARDIGQFTHEILSIFFRKVMEQSDNIAGLGIEQAFTMIKKIIKEHEDKSTVFNRLDFGEFYKQELYAGIEPEGEGETNREGVISSLLNYENREFTHRIPKGVEFEFGTEDNPVELGDVSIKGFIDRFDADAESPGTFHIYDYKTGYIKPAANIKKGLAFQLPVYIKALQSVIKPDKLSACYYSLKRSSFLENAPLKNFVSDHTDGSGMDISGISLIDDFIKELTGLIEKGIFHHSADGLTCDYCDFKYVCHMDKKRMDGLLESRPDIAVYSGNRNQAKWKKADNFKKEWKKILQSMEKAMTLKTASARKKHFETVMEYRNDLIEKRGTLPLTEEYMDSLINDIDCFERQYNS